MGNFKGNFYSESLQTTTSLTLIFPDRSMDVDPIIEGEPKVLYLLHGLGGNSDEWLRFSKIEYYAKKYNLIIVMPEVGRSFYSNTAYGIRYFDYVADELPAIMERWFRISTKREDTFIAGESMGGYGALKVALNRPERFEAVASLSGVVDYKAFKEKIATGVFPDMRIEELDILDPKEELWELCLELADDPNRPRLIQACGEQDFLYEDNLRFKKKLEEIGYGHTFLSGEGDHAWPYWDKAIQYALMFFLKLDMDNTTIY